MTEAIEESHGDPASLETHSVERILQEAAPVGYALINCTLIKMSAITHITVGLKTSHIHVAGGETIGFQGSPSELLALLKLS